MAFPCTGTPTTIKGFRGLYARGAIDTVPVDHLSECFNCTFPGKDQVQIRDATSGLQSFFGFAQDFFWAQTSSGVFFLVMDANGVLYKVQGAVTAIHTFTGATGFCAITIGNRVFLSPKQAGLAMPGEQVYVYDGTTFFPAAGTAPVVAPILGQVNPGNVDAGNHRVSVCFLTATGYVTQPGPFATITSTGVNEIEISGIPTGPAGTVGRVLLITKANQLQNFFIPGGTISDNITTTFTYNNFDSSLVASADFLSDILSTIPSVSDMQFYKGRVIFIGRNDFPDQVMCTHIGDNASGYDTIDPITDLISLPTDFTTNFTNGGMVIRDVLYFLKPSGTFSTQDNSGHPNTWNVTCTDSGLGGWAIGKSVFASALSTQDVMDSSLIANPRGLLMFTGSYSPTPFTEKIEDIWQGIDLFAFRNLSVAHDIKRKRVYIAIPYPSGQTPNAILYMDYVDGLSPEAVKWSIWTFDPTVLTKIGRLQMVPWQPSTATPPSYFLVIGADKGELYTTTPITAITPGTAFLDAAGSGGLTANISQQITTYSIIGSGEALDTFTGLLFSIAGRGRFNIKVWNKDKTASVTIVGFNLSNYTGQELFRMINYVAERIVVTLNNDISVANSGNYFQLDNIDCYYANLWKVRPAATQAT